MTKIICATRAGEGSRAVQLAAIRQAKESGQPLVFLYVIDSTVIETVDGLMGPFVRVELYWFARTLLRIAENRAQMAGLRPDLVIREGNVKDEISKFVQSTDADCLLLGAPRRQNINAFEEEAIVAFARSIRLATGIRVEIIRPTVSVKTADREVI